METAEINRDTVGRAAKLAARLMLQSGAETYRAEEIARFICAAFGCDADILAFPTGVMLSIDDERALIGRVPRRTVDLDRIDRVNAVSRALATSDMTPEEALRRLEDIAASTSPGRVKAACFAGGSCAMFALMFGGDWLACAGALIAGFATQSAVGGLHDEAGLPLSNLFAGILTAALSLVLTHLCGHGDSSLMIIAAMMPFLPGLAITNAIRDAMRGDLVSGVARAGEALMRAVLLACGAGISVWSWMRLGL